MWLRLFDERGVCTLTRVDPRVCLLSQLLAVPDFRQRRFLYHGRLLRFNSTTTTLQITEGEVLDAITPLPPSVPALECARRGSWKNKALVFFSRGGMECFVVDQASPGQSGEVGLFDEAS